MDGGSRFRRNNKKTKCIKNYKEQEILENHNPLYPEWTRHVEDMSRRAYVCKLFSFVYHDKRHTYKIMPLIKYRTLLDTAYISEYQKTDRSAKIGHIYLIICIPSLRLINDNYEPYMKSTKC